jgi:branched-chain amino acid transport system permease protein
LLGGAATTVGPILGTLFMYYVVDITSGYTTAYLLIVGVALILLVLFFPKGMLGSVRDRWMRWLP